MVEETSLVSIETGDEFPSEEEEKVDVAWPHHELDKKRTAAILKNPHFMRKKRVHSSSLSHSGVSGLIEGVPSDVHTLTAALHRSRIGGTRCLYGKNSRKSRDGRRLPKKRGGKNQEDPTDVLDEIVLDHDDPDYDSDSEDPFTFEPVSLAPSDEDFEESFTSLMNEFFDHGKIKDVFDSLEALHLAPHQRRRVPYLAITMALQRKSSECELTSELLSELCGKVLTQAHVQQGFLMLLNEIGELTIDVPKAPEIVGRFIARAMVDDILPPKFIEFQKAALTQSPVVPVRRESEVDMLSPPTSVVSTNQAERPPFESPAIALSGPRATSRNLSDSTNGATTERTVSTSVSSGIGSASSLIGTGLSSQFALAALNKAENWFSLNHVFDRMDNIWGVATGLRGTELLSKKFHELIQIFFESDDLNEITESLLYLDAPHFLHEMVFQAVVMAIEIGTEDARARVIRLLGELSRAFVITPTQMEIGIKRVYSELPELQLAVPTAYVLMERFLKVAQEVGFVSKELSSQLPTKPRKRFVSETDSVCRRSRNSQPL